MFAEKVLKKFERENIEHRSLESLRWFKKFFESSARKDFHVVKQIGERKHMVKPGRIYTYGYDPKWKSKLPYYDRVPLIVCLELYNDGWLGLNLHYLSPRHRVMAMDLLLSLYDEEKQKLRINYNRLRALGKHRMFSHALKRYLVGQLKTPLFNIETEYWETVCFMPYAQFVGEKEKNIWKDW